MGSHDGHRERLKNKIKNHGFEILYNHEILEFILFGSIPRKDTNDLAHLLIATFGGYEEVFSQSVEELMKIEGVGISTALQIKSYQFHADKVSGKVVPTHIRCLGEARAYFAEHFVGMKHEEFHMVLLNEEKLPIVHEIYSGKHTSKAVVPVSEVMKVIGENMPHFVIFAHNHPSGDATPSNQDISLTASLKDKIKIAYNITNVEHMIFASKNCYSFRQNGMIL